MSDAAPLHYMGLAETAAAIAAGRFSSEEVTRHVLERIARLEPSLHAYAEVRADGALADARAADARRAAGEPLGPLHGVPVAVKDLCAMPGTATRAGGRFPTGLAPDLAATVVVRLQAAGAVVVGKAQLTEGAWATHHPDVVAPVNPWSAAHWTGSSSSGSGVCVAAGMAYAALGTDTAGSIRFPSSAGGLVGLKPTWGRVSRHGVFPLADTFDHVGPMARTVLDAALVFDAIAGADPLDPTSRREPVEACAPRARRGTLAGVRIGVDRRYALDGLDEECSRGMRRTLDLLAGAGALLVDVELPEVGPWLERLSAASMVEAALSHAHAYPAHQGVYGPGFRAVLDTGLAASAATCAAVGAWRREFAGRLAMLFEGVDMLAAPVMPVATPPAALIEAAAAAPPLASSALLAFTIPFNAAGTPSLTLPMEVGDGAVPMGFQLLGPVLGEAALISAGAAWEEATGFSSRHPAV